MGNFFEIVRQNYGFLYEKFNFKETIKNFDEENFGNSKMVLSSERLSIIFIKDRDNYEVRISLAKPNNKEFDLELVEAFVLNKRINDAFLDNATFCDLAKFLEFNYDKIEKIFSDEKYLRTLRSLEELEQIRLKRLLGK